MYKTGAVVLNNIGGGINIWVDHLPSVGESVLGYGFDVAEDLAKGGNVAVAIARLGMDAAIIGKLGDDEAGNRDAKWLRESGVDCRGLILSPEPKTGQGLGINERVTGRNLIVTGESSSKWLSFREVENSLRSLAPAEFFITGFEIKEELVLPAAKLAKELGMKVVLNPSPLPKMTLEAIPYVDYFIVNDIEAKKLLDMDEDAPLEPEKTLRALREKYRTENVIMTMGGEGYAGLEGERYFSGAQIPVSPIVDTSGAGDGFLSAMVVNLHWGKNLEEACRWANKYAARVVLVDGTLKGYSTVEELEAFYRERGESL